MYLKRAVDALGGVVTEAGVRACALALLASGACRIANSVAKELQGPVFTPVSQAGHLRLCLLPFLPTCAACLNSRAQDATLKHAYTV